MIFALVMYTVASIIVFGITEYFYLLQLKQREN